MDQEHLDNMKRVRASSREALAKLDEAIAFVESEKIMTKGQKGVIYELKNTLYPSRRRLVRAIEKLEHEVAYLESKKEEMGEERWQRRLIMK